MDTNKGNAWKLTAMLSAWVAAFAPIIPDMVRAWFNHSDNSHAILVPLVSLYFLWDKRGEIRRIPSQGSNAGLIVLILCLLFYILSFIGGIAFFCRLALVASLIAIVWSCMGTAILRILAFPLGFLFFMIPVPDTLLGMVSFPLQLMATKISAELIGYCTIPIYREGNMLFFLNTQLEVAEACSGIRSIMSLTMLSAIFAYISPGVVWSRVVLVVVAIPIAFIANILRVTGTGILAHFFGDKVARGFLHDFSGLAVFLFGLIMLFALYEVLKKIVKKTI
jgi:exosortase